MDTKGSWKNMDVDAEAGELLREEPEREHEAAKRAEVEKVAAVPERASPVPPAILAAEAMAGRIETETGRVLVGLEREVRFALAALLAGGHVLLEGPPGVAKTLLVRTLAAALGGSFGRVQFTPDLMPADITGTSVFHPGDGAFRFRPGPVFVQFLLCDEINRAPAKTQSALLEAVKLCSRRAAVRYRAPFESFCSNRANSEI